MLQLKYSKWLNSFIWSIDGTPIGQSGSGSNEGVPHIPQSSATEAILSDGLVSYQGHSLEEFYSFVKMHLA